MILVERIASLHEDKVLTEPLLAQPLVVNLTQSETLPT